MEKLVLNANAKINLTLDCLGKRSDGYHELEMIMCEIPLYDTVTIRKSYNISVKTNLKYLPTNNKNIAYKAAEAFFKETGIVGGADIYIEKRIPVSAGLAGGSTDAASVLKGLNVLYETHLPIEKLMEIGDKVGKDVPFCIMGGVCVARGTGEKLTPVGKLPKCFIVLVKPDNINVSTAEIFSLSDSMENDLHPHTEGAVVCIKNGDIEGFSRRMFNVLEGVTASIHGVIYDIKSKMIDYGALGAVMSGSGPSVFGVFRDKNVAENAYRYFSGIYKQSYFLEI